MTPFKDTVADGVSANLVDAVCALAKVSMDSALEAHFSWSSRSIEPAPDVAEAILPRQILPALSAAGDYLRALEPEPDFELRGFVYKIEDLKNDEHDLRVSVIGEVAEKERSVEFVVHGSDKDLAVRAIREHVAINCIGTLDRRARPYRLDDVRRLTLRPNIDPFEER